MPNWIREITQTRLTDEPYPRARFYCEDCEQTWNDDDDELCICDDDEPERLIIKEGVIRQSYGS